MPRPKNNLNLAQGASLGLTLGATLCLFAYVGYRIDRWLDSSPFGLVAGSVVGLVFGLTYVVRKVADMTARGKADEDHEQQP